MGNGIGKHRTDRQHVPLESIHESEPTRGSHHYVIWRIRKPLDYRVMKPDPKWKEHEAKQVRTLDWYNFGLVTTGNTSHLSEPLQFMTKREVQDGMRESLSEFYQNQPVVVDDKFDHWRFILPALELCLSKQTVNFGDFIWGMVLRMLHRPLAAIIEYNFSTEIGQKNMFQTRLLLLENQIVGPN